jgi:hypothetical protein
MGLITKEAEENQNIAKPRILHRTVKLEALMILD